MTPFIFYSSNINSIIVFAKIEIKEIKLPGYILVWSSACSPDKDKIVVILNKASYISKMQQILSDGSKF